MIGNVPTHREAILPGHSVLDTCTIPYHTLVNYCLRRLSRGDTRPWQFVANNRKNDKRKRKLGFQQHCHHRISYASNALVCSNECCGHTLNAVSPSHTSHFKSYRTAKRWWWNKPNFLHVHKTPRRKRVLNGILLAKTTFCVFGQFFKIRQGTSENKKPLQ